MGFVSFLSITENGFCRVKIREIFPIFCLQITLTYFARTFVNVTLHGTALPLFLEYRVSPDAKHTLEIFSNQCFSPLQRKTLMFAFLPAEMLCPTGTLRIPEHQRASQKRFIQPFDVAQKPCCMQKNKTAVGLVSCLPMCIVPDTRRAVGTDTQQLKPCPCWQGVHVEQRQLAARLSVLLC